MNTLNTYKRFAVFMRGYKVQVKLKLKLFFLRSPHTIQFLVLLFCQDKNYQKRKFKLNVFTAQKDLRL